MLYVVATPIGNLEDITIRAIKVLKEVDLILAEDTRKTSILLKHYNIKNKLLSFYEHNEIERIPYIISQLKLNKKIALVSNAGTPTISDPGYKLIRECKKNSIEVIPIPGPCSISTSLSVSSIPHDKFIFLGYLPKKNKRIEVFNKIKDFNFTFLFFESPKRIVSTLLDLEKIFGNRNITIARELTKKFEEVLELDIKEAIEYFKNKKPKGEFTVIVGRHE